MLHRILSWLVFVTALPLLLAKAKLRGGFWSRLWICPRPGRMELPRDLPSGRETLRAWAHGASAGDVLCLEPLIAELESRRALRLTVSAFTVSGVEMARQRFPHAEVVFLPFDLPGATRRAIDAVRPDLLILERSELWPALIRSAHAWGARVVVVNGRVAPASVRPLRWLFAVIGDVLAEIDLFLMRDDDEAARALAVGALAGRIRVTGNTKLDRAARPPRPEQIDALGAALGLARGQATVVAGSTHAGEEGAVLDAFMAARAQLPAARLLLAPRYLERVGEVEGLARTRGLKVARRSALDGATTDAAVILLDTLGELGASYGLARVAFVGGSLVPRGGQNMLEPAVLGVPVLTGPHTHDSRDQVALLAGRGLTEVADAAALGHELVRLLSDPDLARAQGAAASAAVREGLGASTRCTDEILALFAP